MVTWTATSSIARSGMSLADKRLGVSAHNVANMNTDGFEASMVHARTSETGGVQGIVAPTGAPHPIWPQGGELVTGSNTDLLTETVNRIAAVAAYRANAAVFRIQDDLMETMLSITA